MGGHSGSRETAADHGIEIPNTGPKRPHEHIDLKTTYAGDPLQHH